jgi:membrane protein YdbS with pleckstrin-like domain
MFTFSKSISIMTLALYLVALATVVSTAHISGYETFLRTMTVENGFFETLSVILLFIISIYGFSCAIRSHKKFTKIALIFIIGFAMVAFIGGMEEISWGQQLFHFESGEFFLQENLQRETNLHNLIKATIFSGVIYFSIYSFFIFIPLFYKIFNAQLKHHTLLKYFDINPHIILVTLFASIFQMFFYNHIGSWTDMITFFIALMLFTYYISAQPNSFWLKLHFLFILIATTLSLWSHEVYRFKNMQYEIRESFVVLASLLIFIELVGKEKTPSTPQS